MRQKAEKAYQDNFFWVLGGIPDPSQNAEFEFYVIPAACDVEGNQGDAPTMVGYARKGWSAAYGHDGADHLHPTGNKSVFMGHQPV